MLPCRVTSEEAASLNNDASTDVHAIPDYKKTISRMLQARRFEQLDCLADLARSHKELFPGGEWKLRTIYVALEKPQLHATQQDWNNHLALLDQWISKKPRSITANIALADAYISYAWDARGHGYADTVSEYGWRLFDKRIDRAMHIVQKIQDLSQKCPEWYAVMQEVALAQGWTAEARQALLAEAIKTEPGYYYYYRGYAVSILPQWGGEEGAVEEFLQKATDDVGGDSGDMLYFQVAATFACCHFDQKLRFSWPRIQKGFDAVEKQTGVSLENWNRMARMAATYKDIATANKMLYRLGDQWSEDVWQTSSYFESIKDWAKQLPPMSNAKSEMEKSANANLQTAEGQKYKEVFDEKLQPMLAACKQDVGTDTGNYKLLLHLAKDGTVTQVITVGMSRLGLCVLGKMGLDKQNNRAALPPPPKPDYWLRVDFNSADSDSAERR